jgi:predicted RNA-binding Zn ribbon-like protein
METTLANLNSETGYLCLDFANTADWHASDQPVESLNRYQDLALWARENGLLSQAEVEQMLHKASARPAEAETVLKQAIALREAIYHSFSAIAAGRAPQEADLSLLNERLPEALARLQIAKSEAGFTWTWRSQADELDQMLWPVVRSAAELLTGGELDRVKECEDDRGCGFLFYDTSRNRSRRWCSMESCGNRAKVRRFRRRQG